LVSKRGRNGGTFATREIAIAYAQWISPAFQMVVCKVFLAPLDTSPKPTLRFSQRTERGA